MNDTILTCGAARGMLQRFAIRMLALAGWRVRYAGLPGPRGVVIVYPHTSNWDFIIGLLAKWAIGVKFRWLGKEALFSGASGLLLGPLLRAWGGEPVERGNSTGAIQRLAERIRDADGFWLALAPEGTRRYRDGWRSGFYHIALTAGVPLGMAAIDYRNKEVRLTEFAQLSGDIEQDLARVRSAYPQGMGLRPDCEAPVVWRSAEQEKDRQAGHPA
ncbi:1-acyl-sn-glycerol-3-phosphate acyltransferase [Noviherbaspirillum galbum]|uniref:Glycerol acyltransferase n=1 Tax=Noviherbaspirillum galbum TaxID=2709383 RepID=A0A6B3SRL4_9BURK|nr:1-acyl-sn-glycerol-3-phosphate acyltransferase [Noviherbaspirillum galbum]NEX63570.1 glycerol acyltransferase [Noviherbaspirillum galbum]